MIYALFLHTTIAGHANGLLVQHLLGVPLGASALGLVGAGGLTLGAVVVFGMLIAAIFAIAEVTRRRLRPQPMPEPAPAGAATIGRLVGFVQFSTAVIALFVPLAAGIYLLVTVAWTLVQRLVLLRLYPPHPVDVSRADK